MEQLIQDTQKPLSCPLQIWSQPLLNIPKFSVSSSLGLEAAATIRCEIPGAVVCTAALLQEASSAMKKKMQGRTSAQFSLLNKIPHENICFF